MNLPLQFPQFRRNGKEDQEQNQEILGQFWCDCNEVKAGIAFAIRGEGIHEYHYPIIQQEDCPYWTRVLLVF